MKSRPLFSAHCNRQQIPESADLVSNESALTTEGKLGALERTNLDVSEIQKRIKHEKIVLCMDCVEL